MTGTIDDVDLFGPMISDAIAEAHADQVIELLHRLPGLIKNCPGANVHRQPGAAIARRAYEDAAEIVRVLLVELLGPRTTAARPCATARPGGRDEQRLHTTSATRPEVPTERTPGQDHLTSPTPARPTT